MRESEWAEEVGHAQKDLLRGVWLREAGGEVRVEKEDHLNRLA